ncbi:mitotic telomere tethering protein [Malassezia pachydermatis]
MCSFDTNAIAGSSMFRLAFPYADAEEESAEMAYLESRFDTDVANGGLLPAPRSRSRKATTDSPSTKKGGVLPPGSTGVRLQGVWIPCEHAAAIASDYGLLEFAQPLIEATALLLPNDTVPLLNPSENLIKTAEEVRARVWEKKDTDSATSTPARQSKRARTGTSAAQDSPAAAAAAVSMPEGEQEAEPATETPSKRRTTRRQTRTSAATSAAATIAEATRAADAMVSPEPLTPSQVDKQIEEAKALAAKIRAESNTESDATGASRHSKRRVEEVDSDDVVVAPQETRVSAPTPQIPHRHPLARGMLTAAGAVGLGAVAWYSGGNVNLSSAVPQVLQQLQRVDYASALNTIQNNIQNWGVSSWFG